MPDPTTLLIRVELTDGSDLDWIRNKAVPAVEEVVEENRERLDGDAEVSWDVEDDE